MKNYKVKVLKNFNDVEENKTFRKIYDNNKTMEQNENEGSVFYCTKERYNYLLKKNAVELIEVVEEKEEITEEEVQAVASAIVEQAQEENKIVEEMLKKNKKEKKIKK